MCLTCAGSRLKLGSRDHVVADAHGKVWRFEMHPYCGPIVLRRDGEPSARQPGERSSFWPAFEAWQERRA